jgi:hypothetical protein
MAALMRWLRLVLVPVILCVVVDRSCPERGTRTVLDPR